MFDLCANVPESDLNQKTWGLDDCQIFMVGVAGKA